MVAVENFEISTYRLSTDYSAFELHSFCLNTYSVAHEGGNHPNLSVKR